MTDSARLIEPAPPAGDTIARGDAGYRPEIEGLRAAAISSVLVFHLNREWLPGGFVGVDIFFVISGYLITSVIMRDLAANRFSFARFYQRRIARLAPAFFLVALATVVSAWMIYTPQDFASAGAVLVAVALCIANLKFLLQGSYFEVSQDAQPFLHYWSLAVEEQFYLFYPIVLLVCVRYRAVWMIFAFASISFVLCVIVTMRWPVWAFYLLPTRAWELLAGCIVALAPRAFVDRVAFASRGWLPLVGLVLIALAFAIVREGDKFPGVIALLPVAGAVLVVLPCRATAGYALMALSAGAVTLVGRLSYSIYLWHWPIFCFVDYSLFMSSELQRITLKLVVTLGLAIATYYLIERPARTALNKPTMRVSAFAFVGLAILTAVPVGLFIRNDNYINASFSEVAKGGLLFANSPSGRSVVLIGDSNASMYAKVIKEISYQRGMNLIVASVVDGDPLPRTSSGKPDKLWLDALEIVRSRAPDVVVLAYSWTTKLREDPGRLAAAIQAIEPYAHRIVLINQPPALPMSASREAMRNGSRPPFFEDDRLRRERYRLNHHLLAFQSERVVVVNVSEQFERSNGELVPFDVDGRLLYHDSTHLSGIGAERVREMLCKAIAR